MQRRKKATSFFRDFQKEFFWQGFYRSIEAGEKPVRAFKVRLAAGDAPALQFSDLQPSPRLRLGKLTSDF
jgi:hypothetical protein